MPNYAIFVDYDNQTKGYRIYNPEKQKAFVLINVIFDERTMVAPLLKADYLPQEVTYSPFPLELLNNVDEPPPQQDKDQQLEINLPANNEDKVAHLDSPP